MHLNENYQTVRRFNQTNIIKMQSSSVFAFALLAITGIYANPIQVATSQVTAVAPSSNVIYKGGLDVYPRSYYGLPYANYDLYSSAWPVLPRADRVVVQADKPCEENVITNIMPNVLSNSVANNAPVAVSNNHLPVGHYGALPHLHYGYPYRSPALVDYRL